MPNKDPLANVNWKMISFPHKIELLKSIGFDASKMSQAQINALTPRAIRELMNTRSKPMRRGVNRAARPVSRARTRTNSRLTWGRPFK